jgi:hypothetical protein
LFEQAMVASLSEIVSLKESAIIRARQRLKESNDEHAEVTKELRRQIVELQNSLAKYMIKQNFKANYD